MPTRLPSLRRPPIGFAHRGARANAPDNTLEAFVLAVRLGATGLESDVWLTRDDEAVLDHDGVVRRRLRSRPIAEYTRAELPAHVPTLADLYDAVGTTLEISLDLKDAAAFGRVLAVARGAGPEALAQLWICHPELDQLTQWRPACPEVHLVHSTFVSRMPDGAESHAALMAERGIDAVALHQSEWTGGRTSLFHRFGVLCFGWDAQHRRILDNLLDTGIDAVYSDHVDRMVDALASGA
ncbi:MAG: glycerophosphodiester phosphodiesterase [Acidimicrobiia bacterium]|nr:glycerophosphodiester phosphodiesterase [Acidimicrobiia bacterium]